MEEEEENNPNMYWNVQKDSSIVQDISWCSFK